MEENVESTRESSLKKNDPSNMDIVDIESSTLINENPGDTKKENSVNVTSNNLIKDPNKSKVDEEKSNKLNNDIDKNNDGEKISKPSNIKPKKELPIEKKPFNEFINDHLLPSIIQEFKLRGFEIADINLKKTSRPIAGDKCWVIYCDVKDICNFWLSFEKEDISSLKSISLCKSDQKPSVIESFLIDEKRITLKLIISRILQRLNGQKLIGIN